MISKKRGSDSEARFHGSRRLLRDLWVSQIMKAKRPRSRKAGDQDELVDWSKAKRVRLPNLKPSTQSISQRLPVLTPADALRAKLATLDLTEKDVANAVASVRTPTRKTRT